MEVEEKCLIWLCACTDLDNRTRVALLRAAKTPKNLFFAFENYLPSLIKEGKTHIRHTTPDERKIETQEFLDILEKKGYFAVTLLSEDYPESLKAIPDPPLLLYGMGNRELLKKRKFCIVGSRNTLPHAEKQGKMIAEELSEKFVIVTGLAEGGDCAAIDGALKSGNLISVLPNGLDECYPAAHASLKKLIGRTGLLLTECPLGERVKKYSFHARNRILAGLSEGVLVISAGARSGTLITANHALEYGRDVFAFPYNVGSVQGVGCNELIKKGAYLCTDSEDIFSCYGMTAQKRQPVELTPEEERMLTVLREAGELHSAALAERVGVKVFEASATLSSLELKGLVVKSGGNRYSAI